MVAEFLQVMGSGKLRRLYGKWRVKVEAEEEGDADQSEKPGCQPVAQVEWVRLGSLDEVVRSAKAGVELCGTFLQLLVSGRQNKGALCRRLRAVLG